MPKPAVLDFRGDSQFFTFTRGRILGRNWDKSLKSFLPCHSQSLLLTNLNPPTPPLSKSGLKLVCNVNILYGNLKSENSQDDAQQTSTKLYVHEFAIVRSSQMSSPCNGRHTRSVRIRAVEHSTEHSCRPSSL